MVNRRKQGSLGEDAAVRFLQQKGLTIIQRNYRFERGEIDIVAEDNGELVFVEVKTRRSKLFGEPEDAVTPKKQKRIHAVAEGYYYEHNIENKPCRFDVVAIDHTEGKIDIRYYKNAF